MRTIYNGRNQCLLYDDVAGFLRDVEATSQSCDQCGLRSSEMPGGLRAGRGGFCTLSPTRWRPVPLWDGLAKTKTLPIRFWKMHPRMVQTLVPKCPRYLRALMYHIRLPQRFLFYFMIAWSIIREVHLSFFSNL